jgi:1,4-dihydroxy-2-naphthoate octaprenyltransferase
MAARPRTLPAAIAPVLVGTALAGYAGVFHAARFIAALVGAVFIQVGTNLSNDYSDARRGAKQADLCDDCAGNMPGQPAARRGRRPKSAAAS